MAQIVDLAQAITDELAIDPIANFGRLFGPVRSYADFDDELQDLDVLHCDVVPSSDNLRLGDRAGNAVHEPSVQIILRQRFGREPKTGRIRLEDIDPLVETLERIAEYFIAGEDQAGDPQAGRILQGLPNATWMSTVISAPYVRAHLTRNNQYTGIVEVAYEHWGL